MDSSDISDISRERLRYSREPSFLYGVMLYNADKEDEELFKLTERYKRSISRIRNKEED